MFQHVLDFLFPRHSLRSAEGEWVTEEECRQLWDQRIVLSGEQLRRRGIVALDQLIGGASFAEPLARRAVHTLKYGKARRIATVLGALVSDALWEADLADDTVVCAVPLHWKRAFTRGFNQAELLARYVAAENGWECRGLLRRTRFTGSQVGRNREARLQALTGAFTVTGPVPGHVLLVDDVCTTGTTLDQCAAALKQAGVERVTGLVVAID